MKLPKIVVQADEVGQAREERALALQLHLFSIPEGLDAFSLLLLAMFLLLF